jgi:hypothetical protein
VMGGGAVLALLLLGATSKLPDPRDSWSARSD